MYKKKGLTWISHKAVKGDSKMAVEFSRRPLLSLLLSLWLSIFNLNCSCNWLEGQQGGTLLVGWAMPHGSQCAGSPLPLTAQFFAAMQRFPRVRLWIFFLFISHFYMTMVWTEENLKKLWLLRTNTWLCSYTLTVLLKGFIASERSLNTMMPT